MIPWQKYFIKKRITPDIDEKHNWIDFLANVPDIRSNTSVCLTLILTEKEITEMVKTLEIENVAYDINSYRDSPPF